MIYGLSEINLWIDFKSLKKNEFIDSRIDCGIDFFNRAFSAITTNY